MKALVVAASSAIISGATAQTQLDVICDEDLSAAGAEPASQGIAAAGNSFITSRGGFCNGTWYPCTLFRFSTTWEFLESVEVEYAGDDGIVHIGDVAHDGTHLYVPASDWRPVLNEHADTIHIVKYVNNPMSYVVAWDISYLVDQDFGDLAGLAWYNDQLYAVEWQDADSSNPPRLFVFDVAGNYLSLVQTYLLATRGANGIAMHNGRMYVSHGFNGDTEGFIDGYELSSLTSGSVNLPEAPQYVYEIDSSWGTPHAEGLTFVDGALWTAQWDFAAQLETPGGALPSPASDPLPSSGATNVSVHTDLAWQDGGGAASYHVYFGTDPTPDAGEFHGQQTFESFDPGQLFEDTVYYWRIDAVNDAGTTTGDVWHFTTEQAASSGEGYVFNRTTTCQDVEDDDPWDPIYEIDAFGHDDPRVYVWLRLDVVEVPLRARFRFYSPDGELYGEWTSGWTEDPGDSGYDYWDWWKFWSWIDLAGAAPADMEGEWRIRIHVDSGDGWELVSTEDFVVRYELTDHVFCRDVETDEPWDPIGVTDVLYQTDDRVINWFKLERVSNGLEYRREWVEPNGTVFVTGQSTLADPNDSGYDYWTYYKAWSSISIEGQAAAEKCGQWGIRVYIQDVYGNWDLEYTDEFQLLEDPNVPPLLSLSLQPAQPGQADSVVAHVEAQDNTYLDSVALHWHDGTWHAILLADDLNQGGLVTSHLLGTFPAGQVITVYVTATDTSGNTGGTDLTTVTILPNAAVNPYPGDGAVDMPTDVMLTWDDGGGADAFNVYLGTESDLDADDFRGTVSATQYSPASLNADTSYYWRIDAMNDGGVRTGDVWLFGTEAAPVDPPVVVQQPTDQMLCSGESAEFLVVATGEPPLEYQWYKDGDEIDGATGDALSVPGANEEDQGSYHVVVTNDGGATPSNPASLTLIEPSLFIGPIDDDTIPCGESYEAPEPELTEQTCVTDVIWALVSGPDGMTIEAVTGVVSWPSPVIGSHAITVQAESGDDPDVNDQVSWMLTVEAVTGVIYVRADAPDGGGGCSWDTAFNSLADALDAALASNGGISAIYIAAGIYAPAGPGGNRDATFQLVERVPIYGGFPPGGGAFDDRDPDLFPTILSGDLNGDDGPLFANRDDNSRHVVTASSEVTASTVIDGFVIRRGNADAPGFSAESRGAGMYLSGASPIIRNVVFRDNSAGPGGGAAVYIEDWGAPTFADCRFLGNAGGFGGAVNFNPGSPSFINCAFIRNASSHFGGAASGAGDSTFVNCLVAGNSAVQGSGALNLGTGLSQPELINCTIAYNQASEGLGGGIRLEGSDAQLSVKNCILWGNMDESGDQEAAQMAASDGGAINVGFSCVQGWTGVLGGVGNHGEDPDFADPEGPDGAPGTSENDDFRLTDGSPCIDAGDSTPVPMDTLDLDSDGDTGEPAPELDLFDRIVDDPCAPNVGAGTSPFVDMGAYEFPGSDLPPGDVNCDGAVDVDDLVSVILNWGACDNPPECCLGDLNCDGVVDVDDLTAVILNWQEPSPATGACCHDTACIVETEADCAAGGGVFQGDGTDCDLDPCAPTQACCVIDGSCMALSPAQCSDAGGTSQGPGTTCEASLCDPLFLPPTSFPAGESPLSVAIGDLDGDLDPDMAVANRDSDDVSIFLNDGFGSFGAATHFSAGDGPVSVVIADVDGDSELDLAVANLFEDSVSVLLGDGTGSFGAPTDYPTGAAPRNVAVGDLDGDTHPDLAVTNRDTNDVSIFFNDGSGFFGAPTSVPVADAAVPIAIADLDDDEDLDLAVGNRESDTVSILLNDGIGLFAPPTDFPVGQAPLSIAAQDLDGDGDLDLVVANRDSDSVSIILNDGSGSFGPAADLPVGDWPVSVTIADLDGDTLDDLAVANFIDDDMSILIRDGSGSYRPAVDFPAGDAPVSIAVADLDGDGDLDLAVAGHYSDSVMVFANNTIR